jgi:DNA-binding CsgD family transcriptional regulator
VASDRGGVLPRVSRASGGERRAGIVAPGWCAPVATPRRLDGYSAAAPGSGCDPVREYEVLVLVAQRLGNKEIGRRLVLSPHTVEKHVAGLLAKTAQPDRVALAEYAEFLLN